MPRKVRTEESVAQNRDAQRRSRARRRDLVEDLQRRVAEYERLGVQATLEMQRAARAVMEENARLKQLLRACQCGIAVAAAASPAGGGGGPTSPRGLSPGMLSPGGTPDGMQHPAGISESWGLNLLGNAILAVTSPQGQTHGRVTEGRDALVGGRGGGPGGVQIPQMQSTHQRQLRAQLQAPLPQPQSDPQPQPVHLQLLQRRQLQQPRLQPRLQAQRPLSQMQMQTSQSQMQTQTRMGMEMEMEAETHPNPVLSEPHRAKIAYICNGVPDETCCPTEPQGGGEEDDDQGSGGSQGREQSQSQSPVGAGGCGGAGAGDGVVGKGRPDQEPTGSDSGSGSGGECCGPLPRQADSASASASECGGAPAPAVADCRSAVPATDETHCDEAVAILIELREARGGVDAAQARAVLGCDGRRDCVVKNTRLFQLMDDLS